MIILAIDTEAVCDRCYGDARIVGKQIVPERTKSHDYRPFLPERIRLEFLCPVCGHQFERNALVVD